MDEPEIPTFLRLDRSYRFYESIFVFLRVRLRGLCWNFDERWRSAESCGCKLGLAVEPEIRLFCFSDIRNVSRVSSNG